MIPHIPFVDTPGAIPDDIKQRMAPIAAILDAVNRDLYEQGAVWENNVRSTKSSIEALEAQLEATIDLLEDYGNRKQRAYNNVVSRFTKTFRRLQNVDLNQNPELDLLRDIENPHETCGNPEDTRVIPFHNPEQDLPREHSSQENARIIHFSIYDRAGIMADKVKTIEQVTRLANTTFMQIGARLAGAVSELGKVIATEGEDFSRYSAENRNTVFRSVKFAQLLKTMFDTPILNEDGNLLFSSKKRMENIAALLDGEQATPTPRGTVTVIY